MGSYAVKTNYKKITGPSKPKGEWQNSEQRSATVIIDRRMEGRTQEVLEMSNPNDVDLADKICGFLNKR